ncbi:hypothetical protein EHI8A_025530 [Entamoeba histolytica HM-1:IMSS-B]|uniref:Uncharacterized protein n=6 Tax=Entamoeba histolytica TaxID=5759 RepID=C4M020_ENTH1|nr:hypothetical protein EHI_134710 [Entamoeba histolytica HM-1:IMSS]EMD47953.1 Hypothetical protein EHI5A_015620 [Entamoeba histolytica KU27]EMH78193.1 hypothetical protein EHI8A_025530 [Entamoeba histolytica HM-1:IMSS-B]EMS14387.1 hypothetical protein KM1_017080 [Entamoeba histolytica HM-3:IMSS]ENY62716.1 hypothetical protein EHI7A_008750 [Entamoeba histolytica HM-1:IMSS-A]GAT94488.1 hypothetical protein CL6EHI_134710 [Entamoeba histolytica]|eukprot:XP_652121.1 hypothetical protein EHI_134710 [Entamoeba histolytica HM-1:IMSS]
MDKSLHSVTSVSPKLNKNEQEKKRKYNSVHLENLREILYISLLNNWGFSFVFVKPKKFNIHTVLPFIHISKCIDPFGNIVFSYDELRNEAIRLKVGEGKKDMERRITQYIKTQSNNILVDCILSMKFVTATEKKSTKAITVNTSIPSIRKIDQIIIFDGTSHWSISLKDESTIAFLDEIHKQIFENAIKVNLWLIPLTIPINSVLQYIPNIIPTN